MKTFFNVLYRRILYKIPLKLLLVILAVFAICFACFSNADNVENLIHYVDEGSITVQYNSNQMLHSIDSSDYGIYCVDITNYSSNSVYIQLSRFAYPSENINAGNYLNIYADQVPGLFCIFVNQPYIGFRNPNGNSVSFDYKLFSLDVLLGTNIPVLNSTQCQTMYNLIPISSVDQNYCQTNNLCPAQYTESQCKSVYGLIDESECTGGSGGSLIDLYINNILHVGAPTIFMNIPEEIDWDYAYTNGGNIMNIDVFGYNVDYEKMQGVIDTQSYIPTEEDFNNIVAILTPYTKIIVFFVFLFIVWAWIKKPFKSKKL